MRGGPRRCPHPTPPSPLSPLLLLIRVRMRDSRSPCKTKATGNPATNSKGGKAWGLSNRANTGSLTFRNLHSLQEMCGLSRRLRLKAEARSEFSTNVSGTSGRMLSVPNMPRSVSLASETAEPVTLSGSCDTGLTQKGDILGWAEPSNAFMQKSVVGTGTLLICGSLNNQYSGPVCRTITINT